MAESKRAAASGKAGGAEEKAKALETALAQIKNNLAMAPSCAWGRIPP